MGAYEQRYPPVPMNPTEYEVEVTRLFEQIGQDVHGLRVTHQEKIGSWTFDFTIRYELGGMQFLLCGEAKRHTRSIERRDIAYLDYRTRGVGGHKGIVVATSPFQSGAREEAEKHGIALMQFVDGKATFDAYSRGGADPPSWIDIPRFGALSIQRTDSGMRITTVSGHPEYLAEVLPGLEIA